MIFAFDPDEQMCLYSERKSQSNFSGSERRSFLSCWALVSVLQLPPCSLRLLKQLGNRTFHKEKKCRIYQITCCKGGLRSLHWQRQPHTVMSPPHTHFPVSEGDPKGKGNHQAGALNCVWGLCAALLRSCQHCPPKSSPPPIFKK